MQRFVRTATDIDINENGLEINKYLAHIKKFLK